MTNVVIILLVDINLRNMIYTSKNLLFAVCKLMKLKKCKNVATPCPPKKGKQQQQKEKFLHSSTKNT